MLGGTHVSLTWRDTGDLVELREGGKDGLGRGKFSRKFSPIVEVTVTESLTPELTSPPLPSPPAPAPLQHGVITSAYSLHPFTLQESFLQMLYGVSQPLSHVIWNDIFPFFVFR